MKYNKHDGHYHADSYTHAFGILRIGLLNGLPVERIAIGSNPAQNYIERDGDSYKLSGSDGGPVAMQWALQACG